MAQITPLLLALSGLLTTLAAIGGTIYINRRTAKKDDLTGLREEIARLYLQCNVFEIEKAKWLEKYEAIYLENLTLRGDLMKLQNAFDLMKNTRNGNN